MKSAARIVVALFALVAVTGMSKEEAMRRMEGQWQATPEGNWTTASAFSFNADLRSFDGLLMTQYFGGTIDTMIVIGESAWLYFEKFSVIVYPGRDAGTIELSIDGNPTVKYRKVR